SEDVVPLRRHRDTQLCSVPGLTPSSSATSPAGLPVSTTMRTAPSRNSASYGGFFLGSPRYEGMVNDTVPAKRRPHDIIHPPGGRSGRREVSPGPKAVNRWCTASLVHDPDDVIAEAFGQAADRDPGHLRPWLILVDGARHQLDLIEAEARRRNV